MNGRSVAVVLGLVGLVVLVIAAIGRDDGSGGGSAKPLVLPAVHGRTPPTDYRLVYRVTTPDGVASEEHVVRRPFDAHVVNRDADGEVTAERWSTLGALITRSKGAPAVRIDTAVAPSASDLRPERFTDQLVAAKRAVRHRDQAQDVGGRTCHFVVEAGKVGAATGQAPTATDVRQVPVTIGRCVDAQGLVLEERWTAKDGTRVLTKRATELELGDDVPDVELPDAQPLPAVQGNGAVTKVAADALPPFAQVLALDPPDGFRFVGRYAVSPARVVTEPSAATPSTSEVALYTDVWRRGSDLLLLDQGATKGGPPPFDPETRIGTVALPDFGDAVLAVDLRSAEVRITLPDDGFVRLSGTIPVDELTALAARLRVLQAAP